MTNNRDARRSTTVTIKDIAEQAGVSFSTVSKALRNSPLVQETTKQRIIEVAERMGYFPNIAARQLVSKKSGAFGVVWPSVERVAPSILITRVNDQLEQQGFTTLLSINRIDSAIETFNRFQVDAILLFYDRDQTSINSANIATNIPILYYGIADTTTYPTVDANRGKSIELAVEHLYELGHRHIDYIGKLPYLDQLQNVKVSAFEEQMSKRGLNGNVIPVASMESHEGYQAAKVALSAASMPTAVISGSHDLSRGILRAANEQGLRVPDQLSIVSYDQVSRMENYEFPFTAVGVEVDVIADHIAQALIRLAEGEPVSPSITLDPVLIVRSSTARLVED